MKKVLLSLIFALSMTQTGFAGNNVSNAATDAAQAIKDKVAAAQKLAGDFTARVNKLIPIVSQKAADALKKIADFKDFITRLMRINQMNEMEKIIQEEMAKRKAEERKILQDEINARESTYKVKEAELKKLADDIAQLKQQLSEI